MSQKHATRATEQESKPKNFTSWALRRLQPGQSELGRYVGDVILRNDSGALYLNMFAGNEYALFRKDDAKQTVPGQVLWFIKSVVVIREKKNYRVIGELSVDLAAGTGTVRFDLFDETFVVKRRDASTKEPGSEDQGDHDVGRAA